MHNMPEEYSELKKHLTAGYDSWAMAKFIYDQKTSKQYLRYFNTQKEFAEYLGMVSGNISRYY